MQARRSSSLVLLVASWLGSACASGVIALEDRTVRDELELFSWRPATGPDVTGLWHVRSLQGSAAAALMDLAYWLDADGSFSGAALFAGTPPRYEVLSGTWTIADGVLQLGAEAEPARAEVAQSLLRLSGAEGSLVLERGEVR